MHRAVLMLLYGTGIRRTEASRLRVSDIDSQRMVLHIRQGKGARDRGSAEVKVIADYNCEWDESKNAAECKQQGQVTQEIRRILTRELHQLGVPAKAPGDT